MEPPPAWGTVLGPADENAPLADYAASRQDFDDRRLTRVIDLGNTFRSAHRVIYEDQLGYSRALGEGEKSATLLNVVRIRYGDSPTFLEPTQVISGYQLQRNVTGGFEAFPAANPSTFISGGVGMRAHPDIPGGGAD